MAQWSSERRGAVESSRVERMKRAVHCFPSSRSASVMSALQRSSNDTDSASGVAVSFEKSLCTQSLEGSRRSSDAVVSVLAARHRCAPFAREKGKSSASLFVWRSARHLLSVSSGGPSGHLRRANEIVPHGSARSTESTRPGRLTSSTMVTRVHRRRGLGGNAQHSLRFGRVALGGLAGRGRARSRRLLATADSKSTLTQRKSSRGALWRDHTMTQAQGQCRPL